MYSDIYVVFHGLGYIDIGTCQFSREDEHSLTYAFQNAKRLESHGDSWTSVGIIARVFFDGVEVARTNCWGFDYEFYDKDNSNDYILTESLDLASEVIAEARKYFAKIQLTKLHA